MTATWTPQDQANLEAGVRQAEAEAAWIPDAEDAYLDAEQPLYRCGWGGDPRCPQMLPARGLCPEHREELRAIRERARMNKKKAPKAPRTAEQIKASNEDRALRDFENLAAARQQRAERRAAQTLGDYRARSAAEAQARRADDASRIAKFVRDAGRPVGRAEVFEAVGLVDGGRGPRAVKYAKDAGLIAVERRRYVVPE